MIIPSRVLGPSQQPGTCLTVCPSTTLRSHVGRRRELVVLARGRPGWDKNLRKGNFHKKRRRKGRPEWMRSPDDTPLRDGTRDRTIGLLTQRAVRTLAYYLSETNPNVYHWLVVFEKENPIPRDGAWDDVSGETFLRTLLAMPIEHASWGRGTMYACNAGCGVDPRSIAQRIMEIRSRIAKEMTQDLSSIAEENSELIRETLQQSFSLDSDDSPRPVMETPPPSPDTAAPPSKPANRIPRVTYRRPKPPRNTAARTPPPPDEAVEAFRAKLLESLGSQPEGGAESVSPPPVDGAISSPQDAAETRLGFAKDALSRALEKSDGVDPKEVEDNVAEKEKGLLGEDEAGKGENAASSPEAKVEDVTLLPLEKKIEIVSAPEGKEEEEKTVDAILTPEEKEEVEKMVDAVLTPEAEGGKEEIPSPTPEVKVENVVSPPLEKTEESAPLKKVKAEKGEAENLTSVPEAAVANVASPPPEKAEDATLPPGEKPKGAVSAPLENSEDLDVKAGSLVPQTAAQVESIASQTLETGEDIVSPPMAKVDEVVSPNLEKADKTTSAPKKAAKDAASPPIEKVDKDGEGDVDKA